MGKMGFNEPPFRRKYGNVPVLAVVDGKRIQFRSKLEYRWAQHLDFLKTGKDIKGWFYEFHTFYFDGVPGKYTPDFLVRNNDNSFEYYETIGDVTKSHIDRLKALFDERPYVKVTAVFDHKPKISTQKRNKLERYCKRIIWDAYKIFKKEPIDMT